MSVVQISISLEVRVSNLLHEEELDDLQAEPLSLPVDVTRQAKWTPYRLAEGIERQSWQRGNLLRRSIR
jgi:hypothetical protein